MHPEKKNEKQQPVRLGQCQEKDVWEPRKESILRNKNGHCVKYIFFSWRIKINYISLKTELFGHLSCILFFISIHHAFFFASYLLIEIQFVTCLEGVLNCWVYT